MVKPYPFWGYLPFYTTDPNHEARYVKKGAWYEPRGRVYSVIEDWLLGMLPKTTGLPAHRPVRVPATRLACSARCSMILLMIETLHDFKGSKLWELWHDLYHQP